MTSQPKGSVQFNAPSASLGIDLTLSESWNGGHTDDPHIGSFLLPFEFIPSIAVFCLLGDTDITEVWLMKKRLCLRSEKFSPRGKEGALQPNDGSRQCSTLRDGVRH